MRTSLLTYLRVTLYLVSFLCLGYFAWYMVGGRLEQEALKTRFEQSLVDLPPEDGQHPTPNGDAVAPPASPRPDANHNSSAAPAVDDIFARLDIPRLGLDVVVLNGVGESSLRRGAGHIPGTAVPGGPGNMGIAAHRDTFFRPLRDVQKGDLIQVTTHRGQESYRVVWMAVVKPTFVEALEPTPKRSLTLVTCFPFDYVGHAPERFIVRAERIAADQGT